MKVVFLNDRECNNSLKNMISIAIQASIEYPYRNFLMSIDNVDGKMQNYFKAPEKNMVAENHFTYKTKGIEYLVKRQIEGMIGKRDFEEAFKAVMDYHLYYLPSDDGEYEIPYDERVKSTSQLATRLERYGDLVFINVGSYMNAWSCKLVEEADLVVISVADSDNNLENVFVNLPAHTREKTIYVITEWMGETVRGISIKKRLRIDQENIFVIPDNSSFNNAYILGQATDYLIKNNRIPSNISCRYFIKELSGLTRRILTEKTIEKA